MSLSTRTRRTLCCIPSPLPRSDGASELLLTVVAPDWPDPAARCSSSLTLTLAGDLCAYSAPLVRDAVIEAGRRTPLLILDLHDVCFCDAAGMHMLVAVRDALIASRGHLSLRPVSRSVERVLTLCGAEDLLLGSDIDASPAPPSALASPPSLVITNRDRGRVIEVLVQGELRNRDVVDVERRLMHLVSVRQPCELRVELASGPDLSAGPQFEHLAEALAGIGGMLTVASPRPDPVVVGR